MFGYVVERREDEPGGIVFRVSTLEAGEIFKLELDAANALRLTMMFVSAIGVGAPLIEVGDDFPAEEQT